MEGYILEDGKECFHVNLCLQACMIQYEEEGKRKR